MTHEGGQPAHQREISRVRELILEAGSIVVLTGAGVSAESGIPTFRDAQTGHWARFRPEDLATPEAFRRDPELVWRWYLERRVAVLKVQPNAGHYALARLEQNSAEFTLVTQNVDGLHRRAGSSNPVEIHGNILRVRCFKGCVTYHAGEGTAAHAMPAAPEAAAAPEARDILFAEQPPRCPQCGDYLRPDVVWFGEQLPEAAIEHAFAASEKADLFLSIGTSAVVYPAAMLPQAARESGATVVEINPDETPLSAQAHSLIRGAASAVLPALLAGGA